MASTIEYAQVPTIAVITEAEKKSYFDKSEYIEDLQRQT